jgi:hypothetical protein
VNPSTTSEIELLTLKETAAILRSTTDWVRNHATGKCRPQIPCHIMGRKLLFDRGMLKEWLRKTLSK